MTLDIETIKSLAGLPVQVVYLVAVVALWRQLLAAQAETKALVERYEEALRDVTEAITKASEALRQ